MYSLCKLRAVCLHVEHIVVCAVFFLAIWADASVLRDESVLLQISSGGSIAASSSVAHPRSSVAHPPEVPHDGVRVLKPLDPHSCRPAKGATQLRSRTSLAYKTGAAGGGGGGEESEDEETIAPAPTPAPTQKADSYSQLQGQNGQNLKRRKAFVCAAGCSEREPQLELSLAPWADWKQNSSGLEMLDALEGFCKEQAKTPFIITVLWQGDVYMKPCKQKSLTSPAFYLIGPEDLSLVLVFLLSAQRIASLPDGPIAFGMYLSDYSSLLDRHKAGPGLPIFAYLGRATSWLIPWPSSYTVLSTKESEELEQQLNMSGTGTAEQRWKDREARAYWIGAVTGPWDFALDADLMAIPRLKLLKMAKEHPKQLQAEWEHLANYGISWVKDEMNVSGFLAPHSRSVTELTGAARTEFKPASSWNNFKYYINLDGVVMGGRLSKLLSLGGVVLQHQAGYFEHIDALVKPYEHYVPIEYDLSDLVAKVKWLQDNDAEAKRIAENGRKLAMQRIRLEDHLCYVWRALEALGSKTAQVRSDDSEIAEKLRGYKRATVEEDDDMRSMLERFWGRGLEEVSAGDRTMDKESIALMDWAWTRFQKLYDKANSYM